MSTCPDGFRPSRVKNNFNPLSKDYFHALGLAMLSATESFVMHRMLEASWFKPASEAKGFEGKPIPVRLDPGALASEAAVSVSMIYRAMKSLVAKNLLSRPEDGPLSITKDYHTWTDEDGETPLLSDAQTASARAVANPRKRKPDQQTQVTQSSRDSDAKFTESDAKFTESDAKFTESDAKFTPHIEERARGEEKKNREEDRTPQPPAERGVSNESPTLPLERPKPSDSEIRELSAAVRAAALRHRAAAGYPNDTGAADDSERHAAMLARSGAYPIANILSSYLSAIESNPRPGKWGQAVATNLCKREARLENETAVIKAEGFGRLAKVGPRPEPRRREIDPAIRECVLHSKPERA